MIPPGPTLADYESVIDGATRAVWPIVARLGYLDDVEDDPYLRQSAGSDVRERVAAYWQQRQPLLIEELQAHTSRPGRADPLL